MNNCVGYFTLAEQTVPAYDPPHDAPCPVCDASVCEGNVKTISMVAYQPEARDRSYFYRVHKTCYQALSVEEQSALDIRMAPEVVPPLS